MSEKKHIPIPASIDARFHAAAQLVADTHPLLAAIPIGRIKQMLIEVELERQSPRAVANRFLKTNLKRLSLDSSDEPEADNQPASPEPTRSTPPPLAHA